jgi:hypothetical protein
VIFIVRRIVDDDKDADGDDTVDSTCLIDDAEYDGDGYSDDRIVGDSVLALNRIAIALIDS